MSQSTRVWYSLVWALTPDLLKSYIRETIWESASTKLIVEQDAWLTFAASRRIQTWALEEARRRLEAEGILEDPDNKN